MQYLHLVHLAERKCGTLACRGLAGPPPSVFDTPPRELRRLDEEGAFFTDGPYIETKEYLAGGLSASLPGQGREIKGRGRIG